MGEDVVDEDAEVLSFSLSRPTGSKLDVSMIILYVDGQLRLPIDRSRHGYFLFQHNYFFQIIFVFGLQNNTKS